MNNNLINTLKCMTRMACGVLYGPDCGKMCLQATNVWSVDSCGKMLDTVSTVVCTDLGPCHQRKDGCQRGALCPSASASGNWWLDSAFLDPGSQWEGSQCCSPWSQQWHWSHLSQSWPRKPPERTPNDSHTGSFYFAALLLANIIILNRNQGVFTLVGLCQS